MKSVEAYWEKRNLGKTTTEFIVENDDKWEIIEKDLSYCKSDYQVLRLPSNKTDMLFYIQETGFVFVEDMFLLKNTLEPIMLNPIAQRLYDKVSYKAMDDDDYDQLKKEIGKGLFDSDRIYIDPAFDKNVSNRRYMNWIEDEKKKGALFYKYLYKSKTIGFNAIKKLDDGIYDSFLGGLYPHFKKSGFGMAINVADIVKEIGGKSVITNVSTNNAKQIKKLLSQGFKIENVYHIFVKHN